MKIIHPLTVHARHPGILVLEYNQICGLAFYPVGGNDAGRDWTLLLDEDPSSRPDAPRRGSVPEEDLLEWGVRVFLMLCDGILGRKEHQLISQPVPPPLLRPD